MLIIAANELFTNAWALLNATRPNKRAAYSLFQAAADLGHVKAQAKLGWAYLLGSPFEQNITKSVEIFQELANKGDPDSQLVWTLCDLICNLYQFLFIFKGLGFLFAAGLGVEASQSKALVYYTFAALGKNTYAQMALGYRYWVGVSVTTSCEKALDHYRLVANSGLNFFL